VTKWTPGYSVPGTVPLTWLMRTPPMPLGTTTMLDAMSSGRQATSTSATEVRQAISSGSGSAVSPAAWRRFNIMRTHNA
jgi:hypothetical protein